MAVEINIAGGTKPYKYRGETMARVKGKKVNTKYRHRGKTLGVGIPMVQFVPFVPFEGRNKGWDMGWYKGWDIGPRAVGWAGN
jgi:hypothetical protein